MAVKLGEMLIKAGLLTPQKLQEALEYQKTNGGKLGLNLVKLGLVKEEDITRVLSQQYGVPAINLIQVEVDDAAVKLIPNEEAPVVRLVNLILTDSIKRGASDIHIEPYEKDFRVRFRIDGVLYEIMQPPMKLRDAITSRLKIMAKLDISEKRLPQDGRIKIKMKLQGKNREMDYRVSVLPTLFGEKIVLLLLDKENLMLDMTRLWFAQ